MPRARNLVIGTVAALVTAGVAIAGSHGGNPAVKARQAHMSLFAFNLGTLGSMAKGETDYDAELAGKLAEDMVALSGMLAGPALSLYFPEGTAAGEIEGTRAKPEIWGNMDDVAAKTSGLAEASVALASAASTDLASLQAAMGPVGKACGACHEDYRVPRD